MKMPAAWKSSSRMISVAGHRPSYEASRLTADRLVHRYPDRNTGKQVRKKPASSERFMQALDIDDVIAHRYRRRLCHG